MLTPNLAEIIQVIVDKIKSNTLDSISVDDISSIGLLVMGYARLVNSGFNTPQDTPEVRDSYLNNLMQVLNSLTDNLLKRIAKAKNELQTTCLQEIESIELKIDTFPEIMEYRAPSKKMNTVKQYVTEMKQCINELRQALCTELPEPDGFAKIILAHIACSTTLNQMVSQLLTLYPSAKIVQYQKLFRESLTFNGSKFLYWRHLEEDTSKLQWYCQCGGMYDFIMSHE